MGFWHTGYIEFHEPAGLDGCYLKPSPPQFSCAHCDAIFPSLDELRNHRFESHPLRMPTLFLQGRELGTHPYRITRQLIAGDVSTDDCDMAVLNGKEIDLSTLPIVLGKISSDVCRLTLSGAGVSSEFTLEFRIASEKDLRGIEQQFESMERGRHLNIRAIDEFIDATKRYSSAIGYCDGICAYLYGVLAKERAPDSSLPYEAYVGKFSKASEVLTAYDRPLARTISSVIEFHFNHFGEAARLGEETRVGKAAGKYAAWLLDRAQRIDLAPVTNEVLIKPEALVTDWDTEQIVRWSIRPLHELSQYENDMETYLNRDIAEYDKVKLHVLLGEIYAETGDIRRSLEHAKTLRNLSTLEKWAESMIRAHSKEHDDQH